MYVFLTEQSWLFWIPTEAYFTKTYILAYLKVLKGFLSIQGTNQSEMAKSAFSHYCK